jgi:nucleoside-diphosphate-sugar epimerase
LKNITIQIIWIAEKDDKNMSILVTGAAGFIGSHLTSRLLAQNKPIRALVLPSETSPTDWNNRVEIIHGDIRNRADVEKAVKDTSLIFHLAAVTLDTGPMEVHQAVTVEGTRHIMEAAAAHFPIARAQKELGYQPRVRHEEAMKEIENSLKFIR